MGVRADRAWGYDFDGRHPRLRNLQRRHGCVHAGTDDVLILIIL